MSAKSNSSSGNQSREVEDTYKTTVIYTCPKRGKVTEEITVSRYKPQKAPENKTVDPLISELIGNDNFSDVEEAGFHEVVED